MLIEIRFKLKSHNKAIFSLVQYCHPVEGGFFSGGGGGGWRCLITASILLFPGSYIWAYNRVTYKRGAYYRNFTVLVIFSTKRMV